MLESVERTVWQVSGAPLAADAEPVFDYGGHYGLSIW